MRSAPAGAAVGPLDDAAVVVLAGSANVRRCELVGGVREEDGTFRLRLTFTDIAVEDGTDAVARFDTRGRTLAAAMAQVAPWWTKQLEGSPAHKAIPPVPDAGRVALFSAWYAMHQSVSADTVEAQARLAAEVGLGTIIVDDGWQTTDRSRGHPRRPARRAGGVSTGLHRASAVALRNPAPRRRLPKPPPPSSRPSCSRFPRSRSALTSSPTCTAGC